MGWALEELHQHPSIQNECEKNKDEPFLFINYHPSLVLCPFRLTFLALQYPSPSFGEALPAKNLNILMAQRLPPMEKTQMPIQEGGCQNRRNDSGLGTSLGAKNFKPVLHAHCSIHGSPHTTTYLAMHSDVSNSCVFKFRTSESWLRLDCSSWLADY